MITFFVFLAWLSIILGSLAVITMGISDIFLSTGYLEAIYRRIDLADPQVIAVLILLILIYLIIFLLYVVHKMTKYSESKVIKSKNGEISVTYKTINNLIRDYFNTQQFVKSVKTKTSKKGKGVVIHAILEVYSIKNLNGKLKEIQDELVNHILNSTGVELKKSYFKIKKLIQNKEIYTFYDLNSDKTVLEFKDEKPADDTLEISGLPAEEKDLEKEEKVVEVVKTK